MIPPLVADETLADAPHVTFAAAVVAGCVLAIVVLYGVVAVVAVCR